MAETELVFIMAQQIRKLNKIENFFSMVPYNSAGVPLCKRKDAPVSESTARALSNTR